MLNQLSLLQDPRQYPSPLSLLISTLGNLQEVMVEMEGTLLGSGQHSGRESKLAKSDELSPLTFPQVAK